MWLLQSCSSPENYYAILPGKEYIVGRKDCEIILENDRSISRKHAVLKLIKSESTEELTPFHLKLIDTSKFGTSVNNEKLTSDQILNDGDQIMFGILGNRWSVKVNNIFVTTSCLRNASEKKAVHKAVEALGGKCFTEWDENCTHLIMENLIMTIKAVSALVSAKPIVTPNYLQSLLKSLDERKKFPDVMGYIPPLKEAYLQKEDIKIYPCVERKTVFQGKIFYFLSSKQLSKLKLVIELGSGKTNLLTECPQHKLLLSPNSIVITLPSSELSQSREALLAQSVAGILKSNFKRTIHESEIGLAVAFNSTSKYCNPDYNIVSALVQPFEMSSQYITLSQPQVLVTDSQATIKSQSMIIEDKTQKIHDEDIDLFDSEAFPESCNTFTTQNHENLKSSFTEEKKRLRNKSPDNICIPKKKIKIEDREDNVENLGKNKENFTFSKPENMSTDSKFQEIHSILPSDEDKAQSNKQLKNSASLISCKTEPMDVEEFCNEISHEVVIEIKSLIKRIPADIQISEPINDVPNYKKFKKVFPYSSHRGTPTFRRSSLMEYEEPVENGHLWIPNIQVNDQQQESQENPFA